MTPPHSVSSLPASPTAHWKLSIWIWESGSKVSPGSNEPQGVAIAGRPRLVIVSTGGDGMAHFFDARSFQEKATMPVGEDADNVRVAPNGKVYVSFGGKEGPGGLAEFDPATLARTGTIPLPLRRSRSNSIPPAVAFLRTSRDRSGRGPTGWSSLSIVRLGSSSGLRDSGTRRQLPHDVDAVNRRLFVVSRLPPKLVVIDDGSGSDPR